MAEAKDRDIYQQIGPVEVITKSLKCLDCIYHKSELFSVGPPNIYRHFCTNPKVTKPERGHTQILIGQYDKMPNWCPEMVRL